MQRLKQALLNTLLSTYPGIESKIRRRDRLSAWQPTAQSSEPQNVWGYADRHSVDPGQTFKLMLSAGPVNDAVKGHVEIYRIGREENSDRRIVWRSGALEVAPYTSVRAGRHSQFLENSAAALGPCWPPTLEVNETDSWRSGYYSIDFVSESGQRDTDIAFIVVTDPARSGDILVKLATATYQAYNGWGGHSLYDDDDDPLTTRGQMVSFDRPTRSEFYEWEYYYVLWLEELAKEQGLSIGYATNHDLTCDQRFFSGYRLLVSVGHDEYWSREEFDRFYKRVFEDGGNTLFLGANIAYWQVRYVDVNDVSGKSGRQLVCYKSVNDPISHSVPADPKLHITSRFRQGARLPETALMGVAYQSNFRKRWDPGCDYRVKDINHRFFEDCGYQVGDKVIGVIGHEWDNRDPEADYGSPGEQRVEAGPQLYDPEKSHLPAIPLEHLQVLFEGTPVDLFGREGLAEAVTFESPAGACVFSAGTIRWSWGLGKQGFVDEKFRRFNRNLHLQMLSSKRAD